MTDNEIRKAFETCYKGYDELLDKVCDLINRQQAEIEKKTTQCERLEIYMDKLVNQKLNQSKSEAIKEFAKRLIEKCYEGFRETDEMLSPYVTDDDIDDLVKEMTEVSE